MEARAMTSLPPAVTCERSNRIIGDMYFSFCLQASMVITHYLTSTMVSKDIFFARATAIDCPCMNGSALGMPIPAQSL
jgi:hypothetical protein